MNLTELLDKAAARWPERPAIVEGATAVSYAELLRMVDNLSRELGRLGISPGCRVGLCHPNSVLYVALTYALWRVRAVVVPIPVEWTEEELNGVIGAMRLQGILSRKPRDISVQLQPGCFFTRLAPPQAPDNHDLNIAFIRFTSGTTSARKGVVLCHETIRDRVNAANKVLRIGPQDTVMWSLPMSHHFLVTIVLYLCHGATIVLTRHVLARSFLEEVGRRHGTVLYGAPFQYALLARDNSGLGLASVRLAVSTTCPLPAEVAADFFTRFGVHLSQGLGVIELGLVSLNTADPAGRRNSVGRPAEDFQVRILDPDENGCGEVAVAGPGTLDAYASPWMSRDQVMPDGWFRTGDIGRVDRDGFLFLVGRRTSVINLAGRKVFPEEIEAVLNRHPAVRESRAYGRLHPHLGEVVEADVVLEGADASLESIREFCRANLAPFKIPSRLHVVNALPRTAATGKIRREVAVA